MIDPTQPLAADELRVYYAWTDAFAEPALGARCLGLLSDDERERHARFHFEHDRHSYLAAHALTRSVLAAQLAAEPRELRFEIGEHGKPELLAQHGGLPLRFNLSHTRGLVACAVTREHAVGVDVERFDRRVEIDQLAQSVFSDAERADLSLLAGDEKRRRFFQLWTLKEAYIKAVGRGLSLPLRSISVQFPVAAAPRIGFAAPVVDDASAWWLTVQDLPPSYLLATASHCRQPVRAAAHAWAWSDA